MGGRDLTIPLLARLSNLAHSTYWRVSVQNGFLHFVQDAVPNILNSNELNCRTIKLKHLLQSTSSASLYSLLAIRRGMCTQIYPEPVRMWFAKC